MNANKTQSQVLNEWVGSVEPARLVGGDHVLDVDEGVLSTVHLKGLEGLLDEVTDVLALLLAVGEGRCPRHSIHQESSRMVCVSSGSTSLAPGTSSSVRIDNREKRHCIFWNCHFRSSTSHAVFLYNSIAEAGDSFIHCPLHTGRKPVSRLLLLCLSCITGKY